MSPPVPARARALFAALGAVLALSAASCGSDDPPSAVTTTTAPVTTDAPASPTEAGFRTIEDAAALRDELLALAEASVQPEPGDTLRASFGIETAFGETYPDVNFLPPAFDPVPNAVSLWSYPLDDKDVPSDTNPYTVAWAVQDANGGCAGGIAAGYPSPDTFEAVDPEGECHGAVVVDTWAAANGF